MPRHLPLLFTAFSATVAAQWLNYPTPGIPRLQDGKPNLSAPAPRTGGFNDAESILPNRRPHSEALHIIERFRRRDFGHLEIQFTINDPKVYAKPWSFKEEFHLTPDTELLEYVCNENEKDLTHLVGGR